MAARWPSVSAGKDFWQIEQYRVNAKEVVGKGSYSIIYKATGGDGEQIAAKRIDVTDERRKTRVTKDLDKLLGLDHPNILKIFDIMQEPQIIWIFMEYCPFGDLNKFYHEETLSLNQMLDIMAQIAQGLVFLHSINIVHRDIKPLNILIASTSPIRVKLTDFDLSKFLGEVYDTSRMSSNVGTAVYKAPEFYLRNEEKKIAYHRGVDTFATRLTYLAMLQGNKPLVPRLETAKDESELHNPIGSTIATRIKNGAKPLNVVETEESPSLANKLRSVLKLGSSQAAARAGAAAKSARDLKEVQIRKLIKRMTAVEPKDRPGALEVLQSIKTLAKASVSLNLVQTHTLPVTGAIYVNSQGKLFVREMEDEYLDDDVWKRSRWIRVRDRASGQILNQMAFKCDHSCKLCEHPNDPDHILESCDMCCEIRMYHIVTGYVKVVYNQSKPKTMCTGPDGTLLVLGSEGFLRSFIWDQEEEVFREIRTIKTRLKNPYDMCFVKRTHLMIASSPSDSGSGRIKAVNMKNGSDLWILEGSVSNKIIDQRGICCDDDGHVFVADWWNERLLVLDSANGKVVCISLENELGDIEDVYWTESPPQLTVYHEENISCFDIE